MNPRIFKLRGGKANMQIYIIDVFEPSGNPLQVLTIFPGSLKRADGSVFSALIVNTKSQTGEFNSYLNGANLVSLANGEPYGNFFGFSLDLPEGSEFSVKYKTGSYPAKLRKKTTVPDPQPAAPQQNQTPKTQINPAQYELNQIMIDYVNQMNSSNY
jgi:hypothetical protein